MNYDYLGSNHNKVFKREKIIYKFYKSDRKYKNEKSFYIQYKFSFTPILYYYSDKRKLLIIENVGTRIRKNKIDFIELKKINDILIQNNIFHNDYRCKNILYNKDKNKYYFIDMEHWSNTFNDYRKSAKTDDLRDVLFKDNF